MLSSQRFRFAVLILVVAILACANQIAPTSIAPTTAAITPVVSTSTLTPSHASSSPVIDPVQLKHGMDSLMTSFMQTNQITACSIAVIYPDTADVKLNTLLFNYGTLSTDSKTPVNSSTEYEIGSVSKLFTADLLAYDVVNEKMQLNDPLQKYLPSTVHVPSYNGQAITLLDLATHTSGLPKNPEGGEGTMRISTVNGVSIEGDYPDADLFNFIDTYKLTASPGSEYGYSNLAFALLGIAEEQVGNASYDSLITNQIAGPLGMPDTHAALSPVEETNLAQGYSASNKKSSPFAQTGGYLGAAGLHSTVQDMATYLAANIEPNQTKLASVLEMSQQRQTGKGPAANAVMGLGWQIFNPGSITEQFTKDGSTGGFNSYIAFSRVHRTGFVMLCDNVNVTSGLAPQINKYLNGIEIP